MKRDLSRALASLNATPPPDGWREWRNEPSRQYGTPRLRSRLIGSPYFVQYQPSISVYLVGSACSPFRPQAADLASARRECEDRWACDQARGEALTEADPQPQEEWFPVEEASDHDNRA